MALAAFIPKRVLNAAALVLSLGGVAYGQNGTDDAAKRSANTRVRPGDRVALLFHRDRELSADVSVNEHGEAAFPKIGMIRVATGGTRLILSREREILERFRGGIGPDGTQLALLVLRAGRGPL